MKLIVLLETKKQCFLNGEHKGKCPKFPLTCPNKCEYGRVLHEDMKKPGNNAPLKYSLVCLPECCMGVPTPVMLSRDLAIERYS